MKTTFNAETAEAAEKTSGAFFECSRTILRFSEQGTEHTEPQSMFLPVNSAISVVLRSGRLKLRS